MIVPIILLGVGAAAAITAFAVLASDKDVPDHPPDLAEAPLGKTRWKLVNAMLPDLQRAASSSGFPLGLLVGWIAKESGGKLATKPQPGPGDTKLDERGYFQLMPDESKSLGLDHQRLSVDPVYSINAGLLRIGQIMKTVDTFGIPKGSTLYWMMVKLVHTMGAGDVKKLVDGAKIAGAFTSWPAFEQYALSGAAKTKHSPAKWMPFMDEIYDVGRPFGFGSESTTVVGAAAFDDIPDPLDTPRS